MPSNSPNKPLNPTPKKHAALRDKCWGGAGYRYRYKQNEWSTYEILGDHVTSAASCYWVFRC